MKKSCRTCLQLHHCDLVTGKMIADEDSCGNYEVATNAELAANQIVIEAFGALALSCDAPVRTVSANRPHRRSRRRHRNG